jgi:hypothetical protein
MKTFCAVVLRFAAAAGLFACALLPVTASATLVGNTVTGCFQSDASAAGLTLNTAQCLATSSDGVAGIALNFVVTNPGVEFINQPTPGVGFGRQADLGADTITITYGSGSANSLPDLFIFNGLNVDGTITGLTLIGGNSPGITTLFDGDSVALLVPDVCPVDCNFSVTFKLDTRPTAAVPLPATLPLLALGLASLGFIRRRQA